RFARDGRVPTGTACRGAGMIGTAQTVELSSPMKIASSRRRAVIREPLAVTHAATRRAPLVTLVLAALTTALPALADDWGMGEANRKIAQTNVFATVSTPGDEIRILALFVLGITGVIFLIVGGLLAYSVVRFRGQPGDDRGEPPQVYGSNPIEFAWTTVPV